jgi:hypothetical protein
MGSIRHTFVQICDILDLPMSNNREKGENIQNMHEKRKKVGVGSRIES